MSFNEDGSIPFKAREQIGRLRERFEDALVAGDPIPIEQLVDKVDPGLANILVYELLILEFEYLAREGKSVSRNQYVARFSEDIVDKALYNTLPPNPNEVRALSTNELPIFGQFRSLKKLGSGGFADVFLAENAETGQRVAIKVGSELLHEAKTLLRLNHRSIIRWV